MVFNPALQVGKNIAIRHPTTFTVQVVQKRGWVTDGDVQAFLDAGYTQQQILEVIPGLSHKVISNYTNHVAKTPVDAVFKKFAWEKTAATGVA